MNIVHNINFIISKVYFSYNYKTICIMKVMLPISMITESSKITGLLDPPTNLMSGNATATSIVVMWSGAGSPVNGYYISWRRTDLGDSATAEYARVTGVMHTLTNLFAGVTYDITVWSTNGTRVSSPVSHQVTTLESGELSLYVQ